MDKSRKLSQRIEEAAHRVDISPFECQEKGYEKKGTVAAPVLIHCSAGIGRTGTLVAIYNIIESLKYTMNVENLAYIEKAQNNEWVEQKRSKLTTNDKLLN